MKSYTESLQQALTAIECLNDWHQKGSLYEELTIQAAANINQMLKAQLELKEFFAKRGAK